ncbi:MAG TPA: helix-turn-helix domain-containing protein, partial [Chloroflexota bacterium]|nr:helix-turn-helix domain-containing protein [Chloroflexota bacterium]
MLPLPTSLSSLLAQAVAELLRGEAVALVPMESELGTAAAAKFLGVSRTKLSKLLKDGAIPYRRVGSRLRIRLLDLYAYHDHERGHQISRQLLQQMTRLAEESAGGYD